MKDGITIKISLTKIDSQGLMTMKIDYTINPKDIESNQPLTSRFLISIPIYKE